MATYYISPNGNNANDGLGPDASSGGSKPWLTLGKALNTGSPVVAGDTVYVAPGYYYSTGTITPLATISSAGSPTQIIGDPTNQQGFKDGSGVLLAPGLPWISQRTSGEGIDSPAAATGNLFNAAANSPSGLQFKFLVLEGQQTGNAIWAFSMASGSDNLFQDCYVIGQNIFGSSSGAPTAGRNLTARRCEIFAGGGVVNLNVTTAAATADANLAILVEECRIYGQLVGTAQIGASGGNIGGGVSFYDCSVVAAEGGNSLLQTTALRVSTVAPINVGSCLILSRAKVFNAGTAGHIVDAGYNRIIQVGSSTVYTNTTQAGSSLIGVAPNLVLPHLVTWGLELPRPDFLGWTDAALAAQAFSASGRTTPDFRGRTARPWGAGSSIGCWQAQAIAKDTGSAISGGGTNSIKLTGAGEISFFVPVSAASTTISVTTKSSSYGGSSYPQLIVVANGAIGLTSDQTATASDASEQQITSPSFTPTVAGVVEVRLISRSTSGSSSTYFDLLTSP